MESYFKYSEYNKKDTPVQAYFTINPIDDTTSVWIPRYSGDAITATIKYQEFRQTDFRSDELAMLLVYFKALYPKEFRQLKKSSSWRTDLAMWAYMNFQGKFLVKKMPKFFLKIAYDMEQPSYKVADCSGFTLEDFQKICLGEVGKMYFLKDGTKVLPGPYPYFCEVCKKYTDHNLSLAKAPAYGSEWESVIVCDKCGHVVTSVKHDNIVKNHDWYCHPFISRS